MTGDPDQDIELLVYHLCPEIVSVREHVDPIIRRLMTSLSTKNNTEEEDEFMQEFIPSCFDDTYDGLMDRDIPLDEDTQSTLGMAVESFPKLIPQVFDIYRKAAKRMFARQAEERRQSLEEVEAAAQQEAQPGCSVPEFTQHLMNLLEERTPREHWDADLRSTLTDQLTYFLSQNTSVDPSYLVKQYQDYLQQLTTAQNKRLRAKYGTNKVDMLKESGVIRRIIMKIPEIAQETFEVHGYNPDKERVLGSRLC